MKLGDIHWSRADGWRGPNSLGDADLVLYFGPRQALAADGFFTELRARFPASVLLGCSTGGQILENDVDDERLSGVALKFEHSRLKFHSAPIERAAGSRRCGAEIGAALRAPDLAGLFVLSDGLNANGDELVAGLVDSVGAGVPIAGGLAGDGARFLHTLVGADAAPRAHVVAAVGFYGDRLRIGSGSVGGWSVFGPRRLITKSDSNTLYQLDGKPALELYERYLGPEETADLPGSALIYPLRISDPQKPQEEIVRTVLSIDREQGSMTFAGNMPEGWSAQLMRGSLDRLVEGARAAGSYARLEPPPTENALAILISCIGRRLLMGQSSADEVEAAGQALGSRYHKLGFYSYGEVSPHVATGASVLHNQTMTVMTLAEA